MQSTEGQLGLGLGLGLGLVRVWIRVRIRVSDPRWIASSAIFIVYQTKPAALLSSGNPTEKGNAQASNQSIKITRRIYWLPLAVATKSDQVNYFK